MYINHWGLNRSPFAAQLNPEDFYASPTHEEALARLQFLILSLLHVAGSSCSATH